LSSTHTNISTSYVTEESIATLVVLTPAQVLDASFKCKTFVLPSQLATTSLVSADPPGPTFNQLLPAASGLAPDSKSPSDNCDF
tara:strand:+ start:402 stop:653 length:252 start_codon:yes stop_codon:yes gene_type:complete